MKLISTQKIISGPRVFLSPALRKELDVIEGDAVKFSKDDDGRIIIAKIEA